MSFILGLLPILGVIVVSFASGYILREGVARRRRAAAREKFYRKNPELRQLLYLAGEKDHAANLNAGRCSTRMACGRSRDGYIRRSRRSPRFPP